MAKNNYFALINYLGEPAKVIVNGREVSTRPLDKKVLPNREENGSKEINFHKVPQDTDTFDVTIQVTSKSYNKEVTIPNFSVSAGTNSWSTFVVLPETVHAFPSLNSTDYQI